MDLQMSNLISFDGIGKIVQVRTSNEAEPTVSNDYYIEQDKVDTSMRDLTILLRQLRDDEDITINIKALVTQIAANTIDPEESVHLEMNSILPLEKITGKKMNAVLQKVLITNNLRNDTAANEIPDDVLIRFIQSATDHRTETQRVLWIVGNNTRVRIQQVINDMRIYGFQVTDVDALIASVEQAIDGDQDVLEDGDFGGSLEEL